MHFYGIPWNCAEPAFSPRRDEKKQRNRKDGKTRKWIKSIEKSDIKNCEWLVEGMTAVLKYSRMKDDMNQAMGEQTNLMYKVTWMSIRMRIKINEALTYNMGILKIVSPRKILGFERVKQLLHCVWWGFGKGQSGEWFLVIWQETAHMIQWFTNIY